MSPPLMSYSSSSSAGPSYSVQRTTVGTTTRAMWHSFCAAQLSRPPIPVSSISEGTMCLTPPPDAEGCVSTGHLACPARSHEQVCRCHGVTIASHFGLEASLESFPRRGVLCRDRGELSPSSIRDCSQIIRASNLRTTHRRMCPALPDCTHSRRRQPPRRLLVCLKAHSSSLDV